MSQIQGIAPGPPGRAGTTMIAGIIVIVLGVVLALFGGLALLLTAVFADRTNGGTFGHAFAEIFLPLLFILVVVVLILGALVIFMGVRILKRGNAARWTAIIVFGLSALSSLGSTSRGFQTTGGNRFGGFFLSALVVVLLLLPSTAQDFREARKRRVASRTVPPAPPLAPPPPPMQPPPAAATLPPPPMPPPAPGASPPP